MKWNQHIICVPGEYGHIIRNGEEENIQQEYAVILRGMEIGIWKEEELIHFISEYQRESEVEASCILAQFVLDYEECLE